MCAGVSVHVHTCFTGKHTHVDFLTLKLHAAELERSLEMVVPGDLRVGTLVINHRNPAAGMKKELRRLLKLKGSPSGVT